MSAPAPESTPVPPGMLRQELGPGLLGSRDEPDLTSLLMSDVANIVTANDYRVALAEAGDPSQSVAEPDLSAAPPAPKKKKAPSKPKGAATVAPSAATPKPVKAAPAKPTGIIVTPKRKTSGEPSEQQAPKRVTIETPAAKTAAPPKKNGKKLITTTDQDLQIFVSKSASNDLPQLNDLTVSFANLDTGDNLLEKMAVDPKLKSFADTTQAMIPVCQELLFDQEQELARWFKKLEDCIKPAFLESNHTLLNVIVVAIEMVCRRLKTDKVHFGSIDALRPRSKNLFARLVDDEGFAKAVLHFSDTRKVLLDHAGDSCNLFRFVEYCVAAEVHISEPILGILAAADLKLEVVGDVVEYRKKNRAHVALICATVKLLKEFYAREDQVLEDVDDELVDNSPAEDPLDAALDFY